MRLRDAVDILRHTRSVVEVARAVGPAALRRPRLLNAPAGADPGAPAEPAGDIVARLAGLRRLVQADLADGGVDYAALRAGPRFGALAAASRALATATLAFADDAARTACWINLYNILTVHGVIALGVRRSIMEQPAFFDRVAYQVGGHVLTLDDLEHGVLRRNRANPISGRRPFADDDPRRALAPATLDPRIHAALVCAARSCPPIALYDGDRLDAQLDLASDGFVAASLSIDDRARTVTVSRVFGWYAADFGDAAGLRAFLVAHAGERRAALAAAFAAGYALAYPRYDWRLNQRAG